MTAYGRAHTAFFSSSAAAAASPSAAAVLRYLVVLMLWTPPHPGACRAAVSVPGYASCESHDTTQIIAGKLDLVPT